MTPRKYPATVVRVVDGDTVVLRVDLGFRASYEDTFRLMGCNAPEGKNNASATYLRALLPAGTPIVLASYKPEKFGRWLADLSWEGCESVVAHLSERGLVTPYTGGKR